MPAAYTSAGWLNLGKTRIGFGAPPGTYNIEGEFIPSSNTWGRAIGTAASDLGLATLGEALIPYAGYLGYKVGKDVFRSYSHKKYTKDYVKVNYNMRLAGQKRRRVGVSNDLSQRASDVLYGPNIDLKAPGLPASTTRSKRTYRFGRGKGFSLQKQLMHSNIWRWQSMASYTAANNLNDIRANLLNFQPIYKEVDGSKNTAGAWMPMYCFDLSTQPGQHYQLSTKTDHKLQSLPFYRLYKDYSYLSGLNPAVENYSWKPIPGWQNGSSLTYQDQVSDYWNQDRINLKPQSSDQIKHDWTAIDLLIGSAESCTCKVHMAVVQFKNGAGPRRMYTDGDVTVTLDKVGRIRTAPLLSLDQDLEMTDKSDVDVFYENFWDSKLAHPLAQYNMPNKSKFLKVLRHEVVTMNNTFTTASADTHRMHHIKQYFISGGGFQNLKDNKDADAQTSENLPPVQTFNGPAPSYVNQGFYAGFGFNPVVSYTANTLLYDDNNRDTNMWFLMWMETPQPFDALDNESGYGAGPSYPFKEWPEFGPQKDLHTAREPYCSFDIKVRSKFTSVIPVGHVQGT